MSYSAVIGQFAPSYLSLFTLRTSNQFSNDYTASRSRSSFDEGESPNSVESQSSLQDGIHWANDSSFRLDLCSLLANARLEREERYQLASPLTVISFIHFDLR